MKFGAKILVLAGAYASHEQTDAQQNGLKLSVLFSSFVCTLICRGQGHRGRVVKFGVKILVLAGA